MEFDRETESLKRTQAGMKLELKKSVTQLENLKKDSHIEEVKQKTEFQDSKVK